MAKKILEAKYGSPDRPLKIGEIEIPCYVLENGKRVIVQRGLYKALGITRGGATSEKYKEFGGGARLIRFLEQNSLTALINKDLGMVLKSPITFSFNKVEYYGYEATILQEIVRAISKSYLKGTLPERHAEIGANAEMLDDAFAKVGIIALVDEATGFQQVREKDALRQFLESFLNEAQGKWIKTFPDEFFEAIFKMKNWTWYYANSGKKPQVVGHYINDLVYSRIGPSVLEELRLRNPKDEKGNRKSKHTQWLTIDYGHPKLKEHLNILIALAKASGYNWTNFKRLTQRALPKIGSPLELEFPNEDDLDVA